MDDSSPAVADAYSCAVCLDCLVDPCTLAPCGHSCCHACLLRWLERRNDAPCPMCTTQMSQAVLSYSLRSAVEHAHGELVSSRRRVIGVEPVRHFHQDFSRQQFGTLGWLWRMVASGEVPMLALGVAALALAVEGSVRLGLWVLDGVMRAPERHASSRLLDGRDDAQRASARRAARLNLGQAVAAAAKAEAEAAGDNKAAGSEAAASLSVVASVAAEALSALNATAEIRAAALVALGALNGTGGIITGGHGPSDVAPSAALGVGAYGNVSAAVPPAAVPMADGAAHAAAAGGGMPSNASSLLTPSEVMSRWALWWLGASVVLTAACALVNVWGGAAPPEAAAVPAAVEQQQQHEGGHEGGDEGEGEGGDGSADAAARGDDAAARRPPADPQGDARAEAGGQAGGQAGGGRAGLPARCVRSALRALRAELWLPPRVEAAILGAADALGRVPGQLQALVLVWLGLFLLFFMLIMGSLEELLTATHNEHERTEVLAEFVLSCATPPRIPTPRRRTPPS